MNRAVLTPEQVRKLERAADLALALGKPVLLRTKETLGHESVMVPDTTMVEGLANGHGDAPPTLRLIRADGRVAYVFRLPGELSDDGQVLFL